MPERLINKLQRFAEFSAADRVALTKFGDDAQNWPAGADLVLQGNRPTHVQLLLRGWACRYKLLRNGSRQIVAFLIPGDTSDVHGDLIQRMDHSIAALGPARIAQITPELIFDTSSDYPRIAQALHWATLVDEATLREWIANMGQRDPYERVAHLMCEMWVRMSNVGLVTGGRFSLPLTQTEIADTVGVTPVTVNRVLQRLRQAQLIVLREGVLDILDTERLMALSGFDPAYLHTTPFHGERGSALHLS